MADQSHLPPVMEDTSFTNPLTAPPPPPPTDQRDHSLSQVDMKGPRTIANGGPSVAVHRKWLHVVVYV